MGTGSTSLWTHNLMSHLHCQSIFMIRGRKAATRANWANPDGSPEVISFESFRMRCPSESCMSSAATPRLIAAINLRINPIMKIEIKINFSFFMLRILSIRLFAGSVIFFSI